MGPGRRAAPAGISRMMLARLRQNLLAWYRAHARPLPWRDRPDPYRVLVSEMMLQQTRAGAVMPYYRRFVARFPDVVALAAAPLDDVLAAWSGLGYYRRARQVHAAARQIVDRHGGELPRDPTAIRELPGVGPYTAGALRSIAFGEPEPVVDGNVARVLARLLAIAGDPRAARVRRLLWDAAGTLLDPRHAGDFNQALMELGATLCAPVHPDCPRCPWRGDCRARREGRQAELPSPSPRPRTRAVQAAAVACGRGGKWLLVRRSGRLLGGMWELPGDGQGNDPERLAMALRRQHRLHAEIGERIGEVRHAILDRRIRLVVYRGTLVRPPRETARGTGWRWVRPGRALAGEVPLSAAGRKALRLLAESRR